MSNPSAIHIRHPERGRGLCGSRLNTANTARPGLAPTCQRCLSILSGERRVGSSNKLSAPDNHILQTEQRRAAFEAERREYGRCFCACNGEHPERPNHGPVRCY